MTKIELEIDTVEEIWLPINGFEGSYEVSNQGRVKSLNRIVPKSCLTFETMNIKERILKPGIDTKGYLRIVLCSNGKMYTKKVHRLVAIHFIPNLDNLPEVNHIDMVKINNWAENLEWCTTQSNIAHAVSNGLYRNRYQKFTDEIITEVYKSNAKYIDISKQYRISIPTIMDIKNGTRWNHKTEGLTLGKSFYSVNDTGN